MSLVHLPDDILLVRLPAKDLIRCTCVCKARGPLITNTNFISSRLNFNNNNNNSNGNGFLFHHKTGATGKDAFALMHDRTYVEHSSIEILFTSESETKLFRLVGCSNGLICLSHSRPFCRTLYLWNPSITFYEVQDSSEPEFLLSSPFGGS